MTTSAALLSSVRRTGMIPDSVVTASQDTDLLAHATEEIQSRLVPLIMSVREEFYVQTKDITIAANSSKYQIPSKAIGGKLRDVLLVVSGQLVNLVRMEPEELPNLSSTSNGQPSAFYMEGAHVVLYPTPNAAGTLRLKYFARPGSLVTSSGALLSTAVSVNTTTQRATFTVTGSAAASYDIISASAPYPLMISDSTHVSFDGTTQVVSFTGEAQFFSQSQACYLAAANTSPVCQIPDELTNALIQLTTARYLESIGDKQGAAACEDRARLLEQKALQMLTPRIDGEPRRVTGGVLFGRRN